MLSGDPSPLRKVPEPVQMYTDLRNEILSSRPESTTWRDPEASTRAWGALMEMGFSKAAATLVSLADGTTSLYLGNGGGIIGAGGTAAVANASKAFLRASGDYLHQMTSTKSFPLPLVDCVRFYVLTRDGTYTAEALWKDLRAGNHDLSGLYIAGDRVLTELRLMDEKRNAHKAPPRDQPGK
jgi:hypothetical protein